MLNIKSIGLTVAAAAVAAGAFSAAPANADIDIPRAWALEHTSVLDHPGSGRLIAFLDKGQTVAVNRECVPENWCQIWSADLGNGHNTGWVAPMTLLQEF